MKQEMGKIEIDVGATLNNILFRLEVLEREVEKLKPSAAAGPTKEIK